MRLKNCVKINEKTTLIPQESMISFNFNTCNSYLIKINPNEFAIIDPGISKKQLKEALKINKVDVSDLKYIYLTHSHSDHLALIDYLKSVNPEIRTLIHSFEVNFIESVKDYFNLLFDLSLLQQNQKYRDFLAAIQFNITKDPKIKVNKSLQMIFDIWNIKPRTIDKRFEDGDHLEGDLRVIHVPGHSPGMCFFLDESNNTLFSSDIHLSRLGANISGNLTNVSDLKDSIIFAKELVKKKDIHMILSGHGTNPITDNLIIRLKQFYSSILRKENQILTLLKQNGKLSLTQITNITFKKNKERFQKYLVNQPFFQDSIIIAEASELISNRNLLRELERLKKIKSVEQNSELWWILKK
ncbi:MAG: MBL fold metallo-hydrolase [Candidatus Lokiarchaeota archaeon]|nr:MBL fold metallo-hydrolase [Candidatus Lokiarchaeota archaeon]